MAGTTTVGAWTKASQHNTRLWYCETSFTADAADGSFVAGALPDFVGMLMGFEIDPGGTAPDAGTDIAITNDDGAALVSSSLQGAGIGAGGYFPVVVVNNGSGSSAYETGLIPFTGVLTVTPSGNTTNSAAMTFRLWAMRL